MDGKGTKMERKGTYFLNTYMDCRKCLGRFSVAVFGVFLGVKLPGPSFAASLLH